MVRLPVTNRRKVGMTSGHHGPYGRATTSYNGRYRGLPAREGANLEKTGRSPDRSLQLDCVKSESLVIADQLAPQ